MVDLLTMYETVLSWMNIDWKSVNNHSVAIVSMENMKFFTLVCPIHDFKTMVIIVALCNAIPLSRVDSAFNRKKKKHCLRSSSCYYFWGRTLHLCLVHVHSFFSFCSLLECMVSHSMNLRCVYRTDNMRTEEVIATCSCSRKKKRNKCV